MVVLRLRLYYNNWYGFQRLSAIANRVFIMHYLVLPKKNKKKLVSSLLMTYHVPHIVKK